MEFDTVCYAAPHDLSFTLLKCVMISQLLILIKGKTHLTIHIESWFSTKSNMKFALFLCLVFAIAVEYLWAGGEIKNLLEEEINIKGKASLFVSFVPVGICPGPRFLKAPETFGPLIAIAKSRLKSCFIYIFLIRTEILFIQEVSGAYKHFLHFSSAHELKMALQARKVSWSFEKQAPFVVFLQ